MNTPRPSRVHRSPAWLPRAAPCRVSPTNPVTPRRARGSAGGARRGPALPGRPHSRGATPAHRPADRAAAHRLKKAFMWTSGAGGRRGPDIFPGHGPVTSLHERAEARRALHRVPGGSTASFDVHLKQSMRHAARIREDGHHPHGSRSHRRSGAPPGNVTLPHDPANERRGAFHSGGLPRVGDFGHGPAAAPSGRREAPTTKEKREQ